MENNVGNIIKQIRTSQGITTRMLEEKTGFLLSKISKIENNKQQPSLQDLKIIADALNVALSTLVNNERGVIAGNSDEILGEKLCTVAELYASQEREEFSGSRIGEIITKEIPVLITQKANLNREKYLVAGSIGKGQYAEIPWVSIFNRRITMSATKGIYIVYLYTADMKGVYLSLNQGYTYFKEKFPGRVAKQEIEKMARNLRSLVNIPNSMRTYQIDLNASKPLGKGYMAGHIAGKYYNLSEMPDENQLIIDLLDLIDVYEEINLQIRNRTPEEFYDYIVALEQGLVDSEKEIDSSTQVQGTQADEKFEDKPKEKQEPVIDQVGNRKYLRDPREAVKALKAAEFKCEVDEKHKTFAAKSTGNNYMESHHLIPISKNDLFGYSLDIPANICSLCPLCHRGIHSGSDAYKMELLKALYDARKTRLENSGIYVTLEQLKKFYGIGQ